MEYIKSFGDFVNESKQYEFIFEGLGSLSGFPTSLIKDLVRKGAGENSTFINDIKGGNNLRKIMQYLDDTNNLAIVAKTPDTDEFAYAIVKSSYDYGKGKGVNFYVDDVLQELLNMQSSDKSRPAVKDNVYRKYEWEYPKYKWRGGRQVKWSGGYYHEHTRMTAADLKDWLPLGEFNLSIIQIDPNRMELKASRQEARQGQDALVSGGIQKETVEKYMMDKFVGNVKNDITDILRSLSKIEVDLDNPSELNIILDEISSKIESLRDYSTKAKSIKGTVNSYSFPTTRDGKIDLERITSSKNSDNYYSYYNKVLKILQTGKEY
jgi:hypothetical protein